MNPLPLLFGAIIAGFIGMAIGNLKNNPLWGFFLGGKCQYVPNSFVPVPPEQGEGYNTPKTDPSRGSLMSKQKVQASVVEPW
jgi:hypothetical protein